MACYNDSLPELAFNGIVGDSIVNQDPCCGCSRLATSGPAKTLCDHCFCKPSEKWSYSAFFKMAPENHLECCMCGTWRVRKDDDV